MPYSVIGGLLARTGWLLVKRGISVLIQRSLPLASIDVFGRPAVLLRWLPGVLFAAMLLVLVRRFRHFLTIPVRSHPRGGLHSCELGPETVAGEISLYQGTARTASVVSEAPSRLRRLTREGLAERSAMTRSSPQHFTA